MKVVLARELRAHGHEDLARKLAEQTMTSLHAAQVEGREVDQILLAQVLFEAERWEESRRAWAAIRDAEADRSWGREAEKWFFRLDKIEAWGHLGVLAAKRGDREAADRAYEWLESFRPEQPWESARSMLWRVALDAERGRRGRAVRLLEEYVRRHGWLRLTHASAEVRALVGYPPFEELMRPAG